MCGITGIYAFNQLGRLNMINLANATNALSSRGPDMQLTYHDEFVGLGHRRLSVIDLSPEASQPMWDHSDRYALIYNGELYNFKELKKQLDGVPFRTESDTEVLLYLLIKKGVDVLNELNGFFAFAFYDKVSGEMIVARDRMGIKPLHYFQDQDKFIFASEMKSIFVYGVDRLIDKQALNLYFQLNYIPAPYSMIANCRKLLPGHYLQIKNGEVLDHEYYSLPESEPASDRRFIDVLEESVKDRLVADVPLGTFLSGGLDSSVISALAARHKPDLQTFSIGFRNSYFDESKYAEMVAKHIGSKHTTFMLTTRDLYDQVFDVLDYLDEPFADSSAIAVNILSKETRNHVTVALSGDGADELLGGYNKHEAMWRMQNPGMAEKFISSFSGAWKVLPKSRSSVIGNAVRKMDRFASNYQKDPESRYWNLATFLNSQKANELLTDSYKYPFDLSTMGLEVSPDLNSVLDADLRLVLPNDMLTKVDLMSMKNSLEVRVPFLDPRVVSYVRGQSTDKKMGKSKRKILLRDSGKDLVPRKILHRSKQGFEIPLLPWFRKEMRSLIHDELLHNDFIEEQGIFDVSVIRNWKKQLFSSNPGDAHATIWALIVFQWWYRKFFDR